MTGIAALVIEADDATAAEAFYKEAFDLGDTLRVRESQEPTAGFRGFTLSLVVSQPSTVDALVRSALDAGATEVKPVRRASGGTAASSRRRTGRSGRSPRRPRRTPAPPPVRSTTSCCCSVSTT